MDLGLTDRVYIVTGATRGLGRATAEALVADGARVVASGRDTDRVREVGDSLTAQAASAGATSPDDRVAAVVADNGDPAAAERLVGAAVDRWGRLDGALISVGGPPPGGPTAVGDEAWQSSFDTIFLGAVRLLRTVAASCGDDGSIALVLSTSVKAPMPGLAVSNGLRPGLAMLAKDAADELGERGIRVNSLLPGRIDTERARELDALTDDPVAAREQRSATIPLRRYGQPEEFGRVAAFVLSPAASYVSGAALAVDGGSTRAL